MAITREQAVECLRRAGANFVVPLALADSSNDGE